MDNEIFSVERHEAEGVKHLHLSGVIDEFADLAFLAHLQGRVVIHLAEVRRINSFGVRLWIDGVRSIPVESEISYVNVPVPLVEQMNMVSGFFAQGQVESFVAPMVCTACAHTERRLFSVAECLKETPHELKATCDVCSGPMELDDIVEQYLAFLKDF